MKTSLVLDILAGCSTALVATVSGALAVDNISEEIRDSLKEKLFTSPNGNNLVRVLYGSSRTAGGLTQVTLRATANEMEKCHDFSVFVKKKASLIGAGWIGNDKFRLLVGQGKSRHYCDISFANGKIVLDHSKQRVTWKV